ncbi:MAG: hypothetical protein IJQ81_09010 [Oscillibacter sp.]|nr:hypothetical protein [Oscillibacter sp.]
MPSASPLWPHDTTVSGITQAERPIFDANFDFPHKIRKKDLRGGVGFDIIQGRVKKFRVPTPRRIRATSGATHFERTEQAI